MGNTPREVIIDPRDFISPPYTNCPKCKTPSSFGVLWITRDSYSKRCRECRYLEDYDLPHLSKKLIYIDQFAVSNIVKALSSRLGAKDTADRFWRSLFEKLDELVKLQLVVCPASSFHEQESLFYEHEALRRMYKHLSNGVTFHDAATVRRFQTDEYFRALRDGEKAPKLKMDRSIVVTGDIDEWQERLSIVVTFETTQKEIDNLAEARAKTTTALKELVAHWQTRQGAKWRDFFVTEARAYGELLWNQYFAKAAKLYSPDVGNLTPDELLSLVAGEESLLISNLLGMFPESDDPNAHVENMKEIGRFLHSDHMEKLPANEIRAALWASLADQFVNQGRKKAIESGMVTDIEMLSTVLPYCDLILIDREMWGLYNRNEVRGAFEPRYGTRVFSAADKTALFAELDRIKASATKEHLATIKTVYGDDWPRPFVTMYDREDREREESDG